MQVKHNFRVNRAQAHFLCVRLGERRSETVGVRHTPSHTVLGAYKEIDAPMPLHASALLRGVEKTSSRSAFEKQ